MNDFSVLEEYSSSEMTLSHNNTDGTVDFYEISAHYSNGKVADVYITITKTLNGRQIFSIEYDFLSIDSVYLEDIVAPIWFLRYTNILERRCVYEKTFIRYNLTCVNASTFLLQGELVWQCYRYALVFGCNTDRSCFRRSVYLYVIRNLHLPQMQNRD